MARERILTIASGHPDFNAGGSETAAYSLYRAYAEAETVEASTLLASHKSTDGATGRLFPLRANEYLWEQSISDWFNMRPAHQSSLLGQFSDFIRAVRPTVVHLHHFAHVGLDTIRLIRSVQPDARIILTLHEFLAQCFNQGQMVTTSNEMCSREGLESCHRCFPERSREDFWLRKDWFLRHFALVDAFVAPSEFLRQRYIEWGIAPEKITVIENAQDAGDRTPARSEPERPRNRFGYFGQVTPFKGIDILLMGLAGVPAEQRRQIRLTINAANLEKQPDAFKRRLRQLSEPLEDEGVVYWAGPYSANMKAARFQSVDWVVVPSIWWENSPYVIQEAFAFGRPVLCSDIGGMAEKVINGVNGRHVAVRSPSSWSDIFTELAGNNGVWNTLQAGISPRPAAAACAAQHLTLMAQIGTTVTDGVS
mgnify:CR=1 FL=1